MKIWIPLYVRILGWFFLNVGVVLILLWMAVGGPFQAGLEPLLLNHSNARIQAVADLMLSDFRERPRSEWGGIMNRFADAYQMEFYLVNRNGVDVAGQSLTIPSVVMPRLRDDGPGFGARGGIGLGGPSEALTSAPPRRIGRNPLRDGSTNDTQGIRNPQRDVAAEEEFWSAFDRFRTNGVQVPPPPPGMTATFPKFIVQSDNPRRYWIGVHVPFAALAGRGMPRSLNGNEGPPDRGMFRGGGAGGGGGGGRPGAPGSQPRGFQNQGRMTLLMVSDSPGAGGILFEAKPWILAGIGVLGVSGLIWFPFVRGITGAIRRMRHATQEIAEGRFNQPVEVQRTDELGHLATSIQRMSVRLESLVSGQKRFLGDVAHELCSPLVRLEMAVGILEQRAQPDQAAQLEDVREEIREMSALVNELLAFSKASLRPQSAALTSGVSLADLTREVVVREGGRESGLHVDVPEEIRVEADPELLRRAMANLVRNALRYGGPGEGIQISAKNLDAVVEWVIQDSGPGVPKSELERIFDPFYRVDVSREKMTGGIGLGLAIVHACITACHGTVTASNRNPSGLEVTLQLTRSS